MANEKQETTGLTLIEKGKLPERAQEAWKERARIFLEKGRACELVYDLDREEPKFSKIRISIGKIVMGPPVAAHIEKALPSLGEVKKLRSVADLVYELAPCELQKFPPKGMTHQAYSVDIDKKVFHGRYVSTDKRRLGVLVERYGLWKSVFGIVKGTGNPVHRIFFFSDSAIVPKDPEQGNIALIDPDEIKQPEENL